ncbi:hypothetical protein ABB37_07485 [Leptomonas pyrrhocoris]|uniref:Uncharacterized protein n=1 Tax=Leptomonas pyrrhocoris TaxID=157538 RepID=A0A0N0VDV0_LEPPY|nr:hypothetical protein ABB37_07485 [Leptomonas pyrrhocoris]KPA76624.1 hypothetical protein ABB37_07485 [Leptomonas pyrrhocoris]|eukprot:XP_015655063.1 hypothetical protein ABB37_07485 [Leptomonas pyrrhocoris]
MDITPSSSRALRKRLWGLFISYSTVEADANGAEGRAPAPTLTKGGFLTCIDALARRSTFRGFFIGNEGDGAIREAAAELQTPTTQESLWEAALAYEGGRAVRHPSADPAAADELASNDHFAENDFFGETCYRGGGSPSGRVFHRAPGCPKTFADRFAEGTENVSWSAFEAVVVLHLVDRHHFVHSFLASEIAALRSLAVGGAEVEEEESAAQSVPLSSTPNGSPPRQLSLLSAAVTPLHNDVFDTTAAISGCSTKEEKCLDLSRVVGRRRQPLLRVLSTQLQVPPPHTGTPKRPPQVQRSQSDPFPDTCKPSVDDFNKPAPPPQRKHTQREAAGLSIQHHGNLPPAHHETATATFVSSSSPFQRAVLFFPRNGSSGVRSAATRLRIPLTPPSVSVSVSVSSSSSCASDTLVAATASTAASLHGLRLALRTSSASPSPRRPAISKSTAEAKKEAPGIAAAEPTEVEAAPLRLGDDRGGGGPRLRLCSPFELNVAQAQLSTKAKSPHPRKLGEGHPVVTPVPEPTTRSTNSKTDNGAASTAAAEVQRPKLACAGGTARGQRRVYTTRRPRTGVNSAAVAAQSTSAAAVAVPTGLQIPLCVASPPALVETWPGCHNEPSMELEPPPTTRNGEAPSSRRIASPSPSIPFDAEDVEQQHGRCSWGRSGTVEHAVEVRRTTALPVQIVEGGMTEAEGSGGGHAHSWRRDEIQYASPEKPVSSPPAAEQETVQVVPSSSSLGRLRTEEGENLASTQEQQQQQLMSQLSPFSTTREPFARASHMTLSRYTNTALENASRPSPAAAAMLGETGSRRGSDGRPLALRQATAPSPTPTPRDERSDNTARSPAASSSSSSDARAQSSELALPPPTLLSPQPAPLQAYHKPQRSTSAAVAASPPSQQQQQPQLTRASSPPQRIGVPRILSPNFTSPLMSARATLGSVSPRQHNVNPSLVSRQPHSSLKKKREGKPFTCTVVYAGDPHANGEAAGEESCCRTPPRHVSPETPETLRQTPTSRLSPVVRLRELQNSPLTTPRRPPQSQQGQTQNDVTTPPPRLSHRARVRSSSRGGRAANPTPPRVPQTRMQMSPSGDLQVTPRRCAPSASLPA